MATTIGDLQVAIAQKQEELLSIVSPLIDSLANKSTVITGSIGGELASEATMITLAETSPAVVDASAFAQATVDGWFADLEDSVNSFGLALNSAIQPYAAYNLGDPLLGWVGAGTLTPLGTVDDILTQAYLDPFVDITKELITQLKANNVITEYAPYLDASTNYTTNFVRDIFSKRNFGKTCFAKANVLNVITDRRIARQGEFEVSINTREIAYVLETYGQLAYTKALKYNLSLDKVLRMYAIIYGELYTLQIEYLNKKALKETGWFFADYEARMQAQNKNVDANVDIYKKYVTSMTSAMIANTTVTTKAIISNVSNQLKRIVSVIPLATAELQINSAVNDAAISLYGMNMFELMGTQATGIDAELADKQNAITSYSNLIASYKSQLLSLSQNVVAVAT